jgi:hypothetical protein
MGGDIIGQKPDNPGFNTATLFIGVTTEKSGKGFFIKNIW